MKTPIRFLILILLSATIFSCKVSQETAVRKVSSTFLTSLNKNDFETMKKYATPDSKSMIEMLESFSSMGSTPSNAQFEILSCTINGDIATCKYISEGEEKQLDLVKMKGKWLVDFQKEQPATTDEDMAELARQDSIAAAAQSIQDSIDAAYYNATDTITYFDICLAEMQNVNGSTIITFLFNNRTEYDVYHLWAEVYFSDKQGKFITKKELMFNNILDMTESRIDSNIVSNTERSKVKIILDKVNYNNIGEIYIYPIRMNLEPAFYNYFYEGDSPFSVLKHYANIKNPIGYDVIITL